MPSTVTTISDLRYKTKQVLDKTSNGPITILHRTTPKGVLLSMKEYGELMSALEDYYLSIRAEEFEKENKKNVAWVTEKHIRKHLKTT